MKEEARTTPIDSKGKELNYSALDESDPIGTILETKLHHAVSLYEG
jgi:hypothetical protein